MTRILYFDAAAGVSGDMFVGALLDLGANLDVIRGHVAALGVKGIELRARKVASRGIAGTKFDVLDPASGRPVDEPEEHLHRHEHGQGHHAEHDHDHGHGHHAEHDHDHDHGHGHHHHHHDDDHDHGYGHHHHGHPDHGHGHDHHHHHHGDHDHDHGHGHHHHHGHHEHEHDHWHDHDHGHHHHGEHHEHDGVREATGDEVPRAAQGRAGHHHDHRGLREIRLLIQQSVLPAPVAEHALAVFELLAGAEAKVHGTSPEEVHFHEVGALDAIGDIVSAASAFHQLQPDETWCSPIHVGCGTVRCAHGVLPVPAPATLELLRGIPAYSEGIRGELATPTGVALLRHFCTGFCPMPPLVVEAVGYGAGTKDFGIPNLLRATLGTRAVKAAALEKAVSG